MENPTIKQDLQQIEPLLEKKFKFADSDEVNGVIKSDLKHPYQKSTKKSSQKQAITNLTYKLYNHETISRLFLSDPKDFTTFRKIKIQNRTYELNDVIHVKSYQQFYEYFIGKLTKIYRISHEAAPIVLLEVQWYYRRKEIQNKIKQSSLKFISEQEIFGSQHKDFIFPEHIIGSGCILTLNKYEQMDQQYFNIYFTRASFDVRKQKIKPSIDKWPKHCVCQTPFNPDLLYILCDGCNSWFHVECIGKSEADIEKMEEYFCDKCKNKNDDQNIITIL